MLNTKEAADYLGVSDRTLKRYVQLGYLARAGRGRYELEALDAVRENREQRVQQGRRPVVSTEVLDRLRLLEEEVAGLKALLGHRSFIREGARLDGLLSLAQEIIDTPRCSVSTMRRFADELSCVDDETLFFLGEDGTQRVMHAARMTSHSLASGCTRYKDPARLALAGRIDNTIASLLLSIRICKARETAAEHGTAIPLLGLPVKEMLHRAVSAGRSEKNKDIPV